LALAAAILEFVVHRLAHVTEWPMLFKQITVRQMVRAMRQALRISNDESDELHGTLQGLELLLGPPMPVAAMKRYLARPTAAQSRALLKALPDGVADEHRRSTEAQLDALERTCFAPAPLLTGDDLVAAGWTPGPIFKRVLDLVYDAQLEDRISTRQQAIDLASHLRDQGAT
jgi:poly(A) polymerase